MRKTTRLLLESFDQYGDSIYNMGVKPSPVKKEEKKKSTATASGIEDEEWYKDLMEQMYKELDL